MAADGSWRQLLNGFVMEVNTLSIIIYVLVPILTAVLGGWVGAYFGINRNIAVFSEKRVR